ncbi:MAG: cell wall hydrolase [Gammaproteobacteria bacterium]|nr:cell wall hydrolase [Acholeplasmataceae bacterium]MCK9528950.1 cell wall hydrolase [Gammaproteobacteria bacterium]
MIIESALLCLSLNIYHEGRDQGYEGMAAVAVVTMNRASHDQTKICDTVFKKYQFSWANKLTTVSPQQRKRNADRFMPREHLAWEESKRIARQAIKGEIKPKIIKKIGKSDHYFNPNKANPSWRKAMQFIAQVGDHVFYQSRS